MQMKPTNKMVFIDKDRTKSFVKYGNENVVGDEFLESCKKAGDFLIILRKLISLIVIKKTDKEM